MPRDKAGPRDRAGPRAWAAPAGRRTALGSSRVRASRAEEQPRPQPPPPRPLRQPRKPLTKRERARKASPGILGPQDKGCAGPARPRRAEGGPGAPRAGGGSRAARIYC